MDESYDGIIIGAGQNGLITAAYLAKAGLRVAVVEGRPVAGGSFCTDELSVPGFRHNIHALYSKVHDSPVHSDLELDRYGVSYVFPNPKKAFVRHDSYFLFYQDIARTCESLRRISPRDAETFSRVGPKWQQWYVDFVMPELFSAPRPPQEWHDEIRRKPGGAEYLDVVLNRSPLEYTNELFESEYCRLSIIRGAVSAEYDVTTRGMPALVFATIVNWFAGRTGIVRGGTRRLSEALERIVRENGGVIHTGVPVERILVEHGSARGVALKDGRELRAARFVASSIDPIHTFMFLLDEDKLPAEVRERLANYKFSETSLFRVHLALSERPVFGVSRLEPAVNEALMYTIGFESAGDLVRMGAQARAGQVPDVTGMSAGIISTHDPSQAPAGGHVAYLGLTAPFDLAEGGAAAWPEVGQETAERMLDLLRTYAPNMTRDKVLGRFIYTPKDIEEYLPDMVSGDICQGKICPEQLGYNRPWPGMSQYRTFIDGLYLCGASTHPGGHAIAACGYNAANAIAEDLGIAKWWPAFDPRKTVSF